MVKALVGGYIRVSSPIRSLPPVGVLSLTFEAYNGVPTHTTSLLEAPWAASQRGRRLFHRLWTTT